jgi:hypothetical protein
MLDTITTRVSTTPVNRTALAGAVFDLLTGIPREALLPARVRGLLPGTMLLVRMLAARGDEDGRCLARLLCLPRPVDVAAVRSALTNAA